MIRTASCVLIMALLSLHVRGDDTNGSGDENTDRPKTLIATVFDEPLYLEGVAPSGMEAKRKELSPTEFEEWLRTNRGRRTYENVWRVVLPKYIEREKLEVTKEEFAEIVKSVERHLKAEPDSPQPQDTTFTPEQRKGIMIAWQRASFQDWKVCKSLYEKYGGRVGFGSLGAWVAFDGQNALLREYHQAGDIKFLDPEIEKAFWQHTQIKNFADAYPACVPVN